MESRLQLSELDRSLLQGDLGAGARMAMSILARVAEIQGARAMIDISRAHIDSTIYLGEGGLEFAERLANGGARVRVPTTLNVSGLDEHGWREWPVPLEWAQKAQRLMRAYESMGCEPTWTCAPYQLAGAPRFGEQIAWGESNAIAFANSVLGARTERYPDLLDVCAAIAGRVPAVGLHLTEKRAGQIEVRLRGIPRALQESDAFYAILGFRLGQIADDRVPVIEGLEIHPTEDQLKALAAAAASSGSVGLFHIVGVTPEAPTREDAFQGRAPCSVVEVNLEDLRAARRELDLFEGNRLDMVVLGSPHFSLREFRELGELVRGRRCHPAVAFLVTTNRVMKELARAGGVLEPLLDFGGRVTVDTCILATPMVPVTVETLMTNSAKYAFYAPGLLGVKVAFGSLKDCVRSAVEGRIVREEDAWEAR